MLHYRGKVRASRDASVGGVKLMLSDRGKREENKSSYRGAHSLHMTHPTGLLFERPGGSNPPEDIYLQDFCAWFSSELIDPYRAQEES
jgi:hypothetical protein